MTVQLRAQQKVEREKLNDRMQKMQETADQAKAGSEKLIEQIRQEAKENAEKMQERHDEAMKNRGGGGGGHVHLVVLGNGMCFPQYSPLPQLQCSCTSGC